MEIILTHENADFDAIAAMLAAHKLYPDALSLLPVRLNQNVADFVTLYQNGLPFAYQKRLRAKNISRIILVDTQRLPSIRSIKPNTPVQIIDHHPLSGGLQSHQAFMGDTVGAVTTLLVEQIRQKVISLSSLEATLLALGIYEDTGSLVYGTTTPRDLLAAAWLLEQNASIETIRRFLAPASRVEDLMSYGVQTVDPNHQIGEILPRLRRIGHEGFPVLDGGKVIGLLTRREADRAIEHGLGHLTVRDIMTGGEITLSPSDPVSILEQIMVESGWGQIPVVDDHGKLIGIVTRTDLIRHWARNHPAPPSQPTVVPLGEIENVLGKDVGTLIQAVAQYSHELKMPLYMVGGAVRDLLLHRGNLDIDFVAEGDAIRLADDLKVRYMGEVSSFRPFGTAKWIMDEQVASTLAVRPDALPHHIDFATARNEFYEHPTALPTVYNSSIKLDLQRRDFTVNTIAIQLSPASSMGRILDYYGGLDDLHAGLIRVLHSLSFVDDPTRILRAVRLSERLGFTIEPRTAELMNTALPMLQRTTGERIRNELALLLRENEPENGLLRLQKLGALEAIHPAFRVDTGIRTHFQAARTLSPPWPIDQLDRVNLYWHILASALPADQLPDWCERLAFGRDVTKSLLDTATLVQLRDKLSASQTLPSQIVHDLEGLSHLALFTSWLVLDTALARERIQRYMLEWQYIGPNTNGHTLRALGVPPGPCYATILNRLRDMRLDGEIRADDEEQRSLQHLIEEFCHDSS